VLVLIYDPWCFSKTCTKSSPLTAPSGKYKGNGGMMGVEISFEGNIDFKNNLITVNSLTCKGKGLCPVADFLQECKPPGNKTLNILRANPSVYGYMLSGGCMANVIKTSKGILSQARIRQDGKDLSLSLLLTVKGITFPDFRVKLNNY
jgi:hypothetical protein